MTSTFSSATALAQHRQHFPALVNKRYFNFGGQGPLPQRSLTAIAETHAHVQAVGPFSQAANRWITEELAHIRGAIATEFGVSPSTLTLTENVTVGCNIPLWGFDWQPGDHVILSDCEHPGVIATLLELQRRFQIELSTCSLMETLNRGDPVAAVTNHLRPQTRMVVISHILWNTGQVLPLRDIVTACHRYLESDRGPDHLVRVLVDAAQSVGVLPLNLTESGVDYYAFTGHKWLCGPAGIGGLYVRPAALDSVRPTFIGWRSITKDETGYPTGWQPDGRRFEVSTSDIALGVGLREAIALHAEWGTAAERYQRIRSLSAYLWERLTEIPAIRCLRAAPPEAGLVSFQLQGQMMDRQEGQTHTQLVKALESQHFMLRTLQSPDCIRACVHYFTLESEIDALIEALRSLLS